MIGLRRRRATAPADQPASPSVSAIAGVADRVRMDLYLDGLVDGTEMVLNQLDGHGALAPEGIYGGPMPQELVEWIAAARRRLAEQRRERNRTPASGGGDHA